jgi:5-methylcytosine-specific restriction endonuclease McrA
VRFGWQLMGSRLSATQRGYGVQWQRARLQYLREHPLCRMCRESGRLKPAAVVDHVVPHKGDQARFWDRSNWQPLCKPCHDSTKQGFERTGRVRGCREDGTPVDQNHHWNAK